MALVKPLKVKQPKVAKAKAPRAAKAPKPPKAAVPKAVKPVVPHVRAGNKAAGYYDFTGGKPTALKPPINVLP